MNRPTPTRDDLFESLSRRLFDTGTPSDTVRRLSSGTAASSTTASLNGNMRNFTSMNSSQHTISHFQMRNEPFLAQAELFINEPSPNDTRIVFPRTSSDLWANSSLLAKASPYFKSLFEFEFAESAGATGGSSKAKGKKRKQEKLANLPFEDSDDERDRETPPKPPSPSATIPSPRYTITVAEAAQSTYFAVIFWIYTAKIEFRHLRSTAATPVPPSATKLSDSNFTFSSSSRAVFPKSVYRLADYLSIPSLRALALQHFIADLRISNVAKKLYSHENGRISHSWKEGRKDGRSQQAQLSFPEIHTAALNYAVANWKDVKISQAMKDIDRVMDEEGEDAAMFGLVSHKLSKRLKGE
ncbi:hypothetical protein T439DRAFT_353976 [Meredithblackwellia eburnea MCA 4105]